MGTNYYAVRGGGPAQKGLHLAKTSNGWRPSMHAHPDYYESWREFRRFVMRPAVAVKDEYGRVWSKRLFLDKLERWNRTYERSHVGQRNFVGEIDGFEWLDGNWC